MKRIFQKFLYAMLIFIGYFHASLATPQMLSFEDLALEDSAEHTFVWRLQGEIVQIRGFWYPLSSDQGILAAQPHLKSCCLKAPAKIQQLLVKDLFTTLSSQRAVTLEGIFKIDPVYDKKGELSQLFILEKAREIPQFSFHWSIIVVICLLFIKLLQSAYFYYCERFKDSGESKSTFLIE